MKRITLSIIAGVLLTGFSILSVFGIGGFLNMEGESILSCVTKSAGIVSCDADSNSLSGIVHEGFALDALLTAIISTVILLTLALAIVFIFVLRDVIRNFAVLLERTVILNIGLFRLKSWISLFELSPGN